MPTGTLQVLDRTGDTRLTWDADAPAEVEGVKAQFDALIKRGYLAYRVDPKSAGKGEQIKKFDARAEAIILAPAQAGG